MCKISSIVFKETWTNNATCRCFQDAMKLSELLGDCSPSMCDTISASSSNTILRWKSGSTSRCYRANDETNKAYYGQVAFLEPNVSLDIDQNRYAKIFHELNAELWSPIWIIIKLWLIAEIFYSVRVALYFFIGWT